MTPFEIVSVVIAIILLAGGFTFGGIQIGRWMSARK